MSEFQEVVSQAQLEAWLEAHPCSVEYEAFLDTEFIKRSTFYPKLGLLQLVVAHESKGAEQPVLFDPLTVDLSPLWDWLLAAKRWVLHAASEDLSLIRDLCLPEVAAENYPQVFDTQVGMSFLGLGLQLSLQNACETLLGVQVDKEHSLSDWLARPLTSDQKHYAAQDVVFLPKLTQVLTERLGALGLYEAACEESDNFKTDVLEASTDPARHLNLSHFTHSSLTLQNIYQLDVLRETLAKAQNLPKGHVFKDKQLVQLAETKLRGKQDLARILPPQVVRKHSAALLEALDLAKKLHEQQPLNKKLKPAKFKNPLISQAFDQVLENYAKQLKLQKAVLMRRRLKTALYEHLLRPQTPLPRQLTGFRAPMTKDLIDALKPHLPEIQAKMLPQQEVSHAV